MSNKEFNIFSLIIALIIAFSAYLMTGILYYFIGTFFAFFLSFLFIIKSCILRYLNEQTRMHESYKFINSFVITLSASNSIDKAFESGADGLGEEFTKVIHLLDASSRDKIFYLINYFKSNLYQMFLNVFSLYEEQGGEILILSNSLLIELARLEESNNLKRKEGIRCVKEYLTMWAFAFVIFLFMRFGLSSFYDYLKANVVFLSGVAVFLSFFLSSLVVFSLVYTDGLRKKLSFVGKGAPNA